MIRPKKKLRIFGWSMLTRNKYMLYIFDDKILKINLSYAINYLNKNSV